MRTLVAMATYSFHRLIMGKVEIGNFFCLIGDNRILLYPPQTVFVGGFTVFTSVRPNERPSDRPNVCP